MICKQIYIQQKTNLNKAKANLIKNRLDSFKEDVINNTAIGVFDIKNLNVLNAVLNILGFNEQSQDGQGLKILTPEQMLHRLPISLAQLKAGNNSEKLKIEIRQLLYSLYRSKKLHTTIYNLQNNVQ